MTNCNNFKNYTKVLKKYAVIKSIRSIIMAGKDGFSIEKNINPLPQTGGKKVIDEANYRIHAPKEQGPAVIGQGGDPLFMNIKASKEQLDDLLAETTTVQDWVQRETSNKVALSCLEDEKLKDVYYEIKDGFGEYGPILLMGFRTSNGVEIPRLKIFDKNGEVVEVLTGPSVLDEINKRALAYKESGNGYEVLTELPEDEEVEHTGEIEDYS